MLPEIQFDMASRSSTPETPDVMDDYLEPSYEDESADNPTPLTEYSCPSYTPSEEKLQLFNDPRLNARHKLRTLTLEEKVSLLTAADFWRTKSIPSKNIPAIKTTDGPNGARGETFVGGTKAALFPCGISLAATWNKNLLYDVGQRLAHETRVKSAQVLLGPTVCMHRHPLGGRNFESFSEDPLLTGKLAAQYIRGLQDNGVAATIKHFVANEQETHRLTIDSRVMERPLREIYLRPFEIAIREANPWALMTSYNLLNGIHTDMHDYTLKDVLRGEWGYDGTVLSDWGGVNSTVESVKAGCDIEFPYSPNWRLDKLVKAVEEGNLGLDDIDRAAENVLTLVERLKGSDLSEDQAEGEDDCEATRELIFTAGVEGLTLLKNEGAVLPICPKTARVAVIGPNANRAIAGGGGSASLNPYYTTVPLDSIRRVAEREVTFSEGCHVHKWLPVASRYCTTGKDCSRAGVMIDWFAGDRFEGEPAVVQHRSNTDLFLWDSAPLKDVGLQWSAVATTYLTATSTGSHTVSFMSVGPGKLYVDGRLALDLWDWTVEGEAMFDGSVDHLVTVDMIAGEPVELRVEMTNELRPAAKQEELGITHKYGGCRIGFKEQDQIDLLGEAVAAARAADVAVVMIGVDAEWESEGYDRQTMDLPKDGSQDRLVEAIVAANPRTVVVNQSGSPVSFPWADKVPTILQGWYQGQEAGNALASVLFGLRNPSGKLPATWPRRIEDSPAFHNWPGENLQVAYGEGIFVGYRHYDRARIAPLFPFGHGLSYTTFEYGRPEISSRQLHDGGSVDVTFAVTNTGQVAGAETVQVYVRDERARLPRPEKELAAFEKVFLDPGDTRHITVRLDRHAVGYWDASVPGWIAEEGMFSVLIGASACDIRQSSWFEVKETFSWVF